MKNKKVLVVDDESIVREVLQRYLSRKGYEVLTADNGEQAILYYKAWDPCMVLLDIMMPGVSGTEIMRKIREYDPEARIIVITAIKDRDTGAFVFKNGGKDIITKPINFDYLINSVMINSVVAK